MEKNIRKRVKNICFTLKKCLCEGQERELLHLETLKTAKDGSAKEEVRVTI
jgi:hypothetical protein